MPGTDYAAPKSQVTKRSQRTTKNHKERRMASRRILERSLNSCEQKRLDISFAVFVLVLTPVLYNTFWMIYLHRTTTPDLCLAYEAQYQKAGTRNANNERQNRRTVSNKTLYPLTREFPYVINNPNICTNVSNLKFLIIVHSYTEHFQRRRIIRETWGNKNIFKSVNLRIVFFLGLTINKTTQELIENESVVYGDVVQGNFLDSYHNLTHKGVMAYRWIEEFCQQAEMIAKVDDDVFLNIFILLEKYHSILNNTKRSILCELCKENNSLIRRNQTKWNIDKNLFRGYTYYPFKYCMGYTVLITRDLIRPMYRASSFTPFFWVDDVYLYGMLPNKVGNVTFKNIRKDLSKITNTGLKCYLKRKNCPILAMVAWDNDKSVVFKLWYAALSKMSSKMKKQVNPLLISMRHS